MKKLIEKALVEGIKSQNDAATLLTLYITEIKKEEYPHILIKEIFLACMQIRSVD